LKEEEKLIEVLQRNKQAIRWTLSNLKEVSPSYYMHKILMEEHINQLLNLNEDSTLLRKR